MTTAKISELTVATSAATTDLIEISQDQGDTTYLSRKITKANALADYAKLDGSNQPFTGELSIVVPTGATTKHLLITSSATNNNIKYARIASKHYVSDTEEDVLYIYVIDNSTSNTLNLGGGGSSFNAATDINLITAANYNTTRGTVRMAVNKDGLVGIGMESDTPSGRLDIHGAGTTTGITLQTAGSDGTARFQVQDNGTVTVTPAAAALGQSSITKGLVVNAGLGGAVADVFNAKGSTDQNLIITDPTNNRVGIGMTPTNKLDVSGVLGINNAVGQSSFAKGLIVNTSNGNASTDAFDVRCSNNSTIILTNPSGCKLGFFNATPVAQQAGTGETVGFTAGAGTAVNDDSTFTGNIGSTAYRINDIVKALKNLGILAS